MNHSVTFSIKLRPLNPSHRSHLSRCTQHLTESLNRTMSSTVLQFLDRDLLRKVVVAQLDDLGENAQNLEVLQLLLPLLDADLLHLIYPELERFLISTITSNHQERYSYITSFIEVFPTLPDCVVETIIPLLREEALNKFNFVQKISEPESMKGTDDKEEAKENGVIFSSNSVNTQDLLNIFGFLSYLFTTDSNRLLSVLTKLDKYLAPFLGHKDETVASKCLKLMRWRFDLISARSLSDDRVAAYYWGILWDIKRSATSRLHASNVYIMWLQLIAASSGNLKGNAYFQEEIISQEFYWALLQEGLGSASHEQRKYCLSILQYSVKLINCTFSVPIFEWNTSKSDQLLREWNRFITLYEILGIDTSLHQLQAAKNDILYIMTPNSYVHASWGFCLLSTGFQASMDSVRRATSLILLGLKGKSLQSLKHGLLYYEKQFLPYMMLSRHFIIRRSQDTSKVLRCEYGERLADFLSALIQNMPSDEEAANVVRSTMKVLVSVKDCFDAVKIYALWGIVRGLNNKKVLQFGIDDELLTALFDSPTEGELYNKVVQTLNLRLVLSMKATSMGPIVGLLLKFINHNGYVIVQQNISLVKTYFQSQNFTANECNDMIFTNCSVTSVMLLIQIILAIDKDFVIDSEVVYKKYGDALIAKLIANGCRAACFSVRINSLIKSALLQKELIDVYLSLYRGLRLDDFSSDVLINDLWNDIFESLELVTSERIVLVLPKLKLFNLITEISGFHDASFSVFEITPFLISFYFNNSRLSLSINCYYKLVNSIVGELHKLVYNKLLVENYDAEIIEALMPQLHSYSAHSVTLQAICKIMIVCLDRKLTSASKITEVIGCLNDTVKTLDENRFKLEDRALHHLLIDVFLHPELLVQSIGDSALSEYQSEFCKIFISNSHGRKGLMPRITNCLLGFQASYPEYFERLTFLPEILLESATLRQLENTVFQVEGVIGTLYDNFLSPTPNSNIYADIYGPAEVAYKVKLCAIFNSGVSESFAQKLVDICFERSSPLNMDDNVRFNDGNHEYARCQVSKIIVSVMDKLNFEYSLQANLPKLYGSVESDPSPLVRVYLEWAIAYHLRFSPNHLDEAYNRLLLLLRNHELKPVLITIYGRILFLAIQSMPPKDEEDYMSRLICLIIPAAATNKAVARHFSMSLAISIYEEIAKKKLEISSDLVAIIKNMYLTAVGTSAFSQFRSGSACLWDVIQDLNLYHISGGLLVELNDRTFDNLTVTEFTDYLSKDAIANLCHPIGGPRDTQWSGEKSVLDNPVCREHNNKTVSPLQTKSGAWSTIVDVHKETEISHVVRSELIIVASLVNKPPNLGGICRLCDVLGAGLITLHDIKIKEHPQFKNVAVTADYWMPMMEVRPELIKSFLRRKKKEGYTLMGLEQTDKSVVLDSKLGFPKKTLILLGREKEGIPGELLAELDICVEIKQVGVIRSMNIQTATAVIVHAYSSQNC